MVNIQTSTVYCERLFLVTLSGNTDSIDLGILWPSPAGGGGEGDNSPLGFPGFVFKKN